MNSEFQFPKERPRIGNANIPLSDLPLDAYTRAPRSTVAMTKAMGIVEPIILADKGDDGYAILDGRRRIAAAREVGLESAPARVFDAADVESYMAALAVLLNEERSSNHVTNYESVRYLAIDKGVPIERIAKSTSLTVPTVRSYLACTSIHSELIAGWKQGLVKFSVLKRLGKFPRSVQFHAVSTFLHKGKPVTARDVSEMVGDKKETNAGVFDGDKLADWTSGAIVKLKDMLETVPTGAPEGAVALAKSALELLQGVPAAA